jgi:radical SAM superfamily enzyme YgiQ (UPF0313 family)
MRVLLVKPSPGSDQFGLAPFFQTEPLGLEYLAAALGPQGHSVVVVDMRFDRRQIAEILRDCQPEFVGISCLHILDVPAALGLADRIKAHDAGIFVAAGGHAASAYPAALDESRSIDAICLGEGEELMPSLCEAVVRRRPIEDLPSLLVPSGNGGFRPTREGTGWLDLEGVNTPDRATVRDYQRDYCCLNYIPVWTMETARGCPYRCKFCSVWQFYRRTHRFHAPGRVRADFEAVGRNVFIVDDIFWANREQSEELAAALLRSPVRKNWLLAQARADLVAQSGDLLRMWRPLARNFDIFFGFESPTRQGLDALNKETDIAKTVAAIRLARELGFGVTGNFIIDPDFGEDDFAALWDFLDTHQLRRVGFTILTPLPGTYYFEQSKSRIQVFDWDHYDLHHLLWRPRLPLERFFELYCQTWRRSVLNAGGPKRWWQWLKQVRLRDVPRLARILGRTQVLMDPKAYLAETKVPGWRG